MAKLEDWPRDREWMHYRDPSQFTTETLFSIAQDKSPGHERVATAMNEFLGRDNRDIPDDVLRKVEFFQIVFECDVTLSALTRAM